MPLTPEQLAEAIRNRSGTDKNVPNRIHAAIVARKLAGKADQPGGLGIKDAVKLAEATERAGFLGDLPDYQILPNND